jgi:hypothetical protein
MAAFRRSGVRAILPGRRGVAAGLAALTLFLLARLFPAVAESVYGRIFYPHLARLLAGISALVPFSIAEWVFALVIVSLVLAWPQGARRARRAGASWPRAAAEGATTLLGRAGGWWCLFVVCWGMNYARPLPDAQFGLLAAKGGKERLAEIADAVGARVDAERQGLAETPDGTVAEPGDMASLDAHLRVLQAAALAESGFPVVDAGRAKTFFLSPLLLRWGVSGTYGPFTGEPNIVWPSVPGLLPFTLAHERAHLSGFAQEEDASFVALLTCWRSPRPEVRYSAWLALYLELRLEAKTRAPGVVRDILAMSRFLKQHRGTEAGAVWSTYSGYLKLHGVHGGVRSYGRVAGLALRWLDVHGFPP